MDQISGLDSQKREKIAQLNQLRSSGEIIITSIIISSISYKVLYAIASKLCTSKITRYKMIRKRMDQNSGLDSRKEKQIA